ncbi:MAG: hypothetical protein IH862_10665 [Chloroflexi bacterium]|nr:hypothetical protein [Chloroflexota bacterium]
MINGKSHQLGEVAPMAVDTKASDRGLSHDTFTAMVGQMVVQCKALLRQQLEHKATKQPLLYDQERIGRIMAEFEAGSADIQDAIAARVMSRLTHHVRQEVMRVLQDALSDAAQSLEDPLWEQSKTWGNTGWIQRGDSVEHETVAEEPARPEPEPVVQPEPFVRDEPEAVAAEPVSIVESRVEEIASSVDEAGPDEDAPRSGGIGEVYEGTVKLRVDATDSFRQVIQFVEALRQKAGFRLLKLVGGFEDGVDIWVGLKAPIAINEVLLTMPGVAQVTPAHWLEQDASEPLINIRLANDPVPQNAD